MPGYLHIHRHHQRDVGKVRAPYERVVEHNDIARRKFALRHRRRDRHRHRTQVHRHVIAHGDNLARGIEDGARVVAALFDVGRKRRAAQRGSHLFRDRVVQVLEDLEFDRIGHGKMG